MLRHVRRIRRQTQRDRLALVVRQRRHVLVGLDEELRADDGDISLDARRRRMRYLAGS